MLPFDWRSVKAERLAVVSGGCRRVRLQDRGIEGVVKHVPPLLVHDKVALVTLLVAKLTITTYFVPFPRGMGNGIRITVGDRSRVRVATFVPCARVTEVGRKVPTDVRVRKCAAKASDRLGKGIGAMCGRMLGGRKGGCFQVSLGLSGTISCFGVGDNVRNAMTVLLSSRDLVKGLFPTDPFG